MSRAMVTLGASFVALVGQMTGQLADAQTIQTLPVRKVVPIAAMPSEATLVRSALEECNNAKDAQGPGVASVAFTVPLPDGNTGTIRCSYSSTGQVRVTIGTRAAKVVRYRATGGDK